MRSRFLIAALFTALLICPEAAEACPMCKSAAEADDRLPRAFFASIMFMMGMPVALATGFGIAFWRLSKRPQDWRPEDYSAER
ncbi:hypothetical protein [Alienimonas chondri]|uniref:Uncharacterized protein n=1 Tax=Alienimonas chondri TaxID=2681879 RepID=A0ABX1VE73_9PLAN|nr:hypothetical protein [Alienimonas chondri]NNJ26182.1 hypothetical protein [Alienimonas chondri]